MSRIQIAVIEASRNLAGLSDANSNEFNENSTNKVIDFMPVRATISKRAALCVSVHTLCDPQGHNDGEMLRRGTYFRTSQTQI